MRKHFGKKTTAEQYDANLDGIGRKSLASHAQMFKRWDSSQIGIFDHHDKRNAPASGLSDLFEQMLDL